MERLTLLIFSRNDIDQLLGLIKDMYDVADQIVVIDSSNEKHLDKLKHEIGEVDSKGKVVIRWVVALGYSEPVRMWALKFCKTEWIVLLDTDERLNGALKADIKSIVSDAKCDAFAIKRYEEVKNGVRQSDFFTWQIRLFRKSKILFRGMLHEQPLVNGILEKMHSEYYIEHRIELMHHEVNEYSRISKIFDRLSYGTYNDILLDYISKLIMPKDREIKDSITGKIIYALLRAYEAITLRRQEQELSNFDYFMFSFVRNAVFGLKMTGVRSIPGAWKGAKWYTNQIRQWKGEPDSKELFEISKIVNKEGIIRYLNLDKDETIERLNEKYKNEKQGIELLIRLLKERYNS